MALLWVNYRYPLRSCREISRMEPPKRAAQYLRMSTDAQRYSIGNQSAAIALHAFSNGFEIVRTYEDAAKSGLTFHGRPGLRSLISDIISGSADFDTVLVLDISRWGRFQDPDQAAHYEFLCREAGVEVVYCAEAFINDGTAASSIVKHLKRVMAAEYSRELSERVRAAKLRQIESGALLGAPPPYGIRRELRDADGNQICILAKGQKKAIKSYRSWLVRGPAEEVRTTREMFRMFDRDGLCMDEIARRLNGRGIPSSTEKPWNGIKVRAVLRNELAIGYCVWGKSKITLKGPRERQPPSDWIRTKVMSPIVPLEQFKRVAARLDAREKGARLTKSEMLSRLKRLWQKRGSLDHRALTQCPYTPKAETYARVFGSFSEALRLIGYDRPKGIRWRPPNGRVATNDEIIKALRALHQQHGYLSCTLIASCKSVPSPALLRSRFGSMKAAYEAVGFCATHSEIQVAAVARKRAHLASANH